MLASVARSGTVSACAAGPKNSNTCSDHPGCAELLGERQCHVGHGDAVGERPLETDTSEFRLWEDVRLAKHDCFDLDTPHAPPEHAQSIHHWCVRVSSDGEIWKCDGWRPRRGLAERPP